MLPFFSEPVRQRRQPPARLRLGGAAGGRDCAPARGRASSAPACATSSSRAAPPRPTTSPLLGVVQATRDNGPRTPDSRLPTPASRHVITLSTEHPAVLDPCVFLESQGVRVTRVPVQSDGIVDLALAAAAITPGTTLVSAMAGNNEIGVVQPLAALAQLAHAAGAWFHTDASQAASLVDIDMAAMGIDLLSYTAHKMYGPKGVGALVVRRASKVPLAPLHHGGGHERGLRSGTLNVPGIVGFGEAARLALARRASDAARLALLRDRLWDAPARGAAGRLPPRGGEPAAAAQPERRVRRPDRPRPRARPDRRRRLARGGVRVDVCRAVARADGPGPRRGRRPVLVAVRPAPDHHRGRGGRPGRTGGPRR